MRYIVLIILLFLAAGCEEKNIKPVIMEAVDTDRIPVQESWDSQIIFTDNGEQQAILYADHIIVYEDEAEKAKHLEGVKIDFYDKDGQISSVLTSKRGRVDDVTNDMYAIDSVVAVSDSGVVLETDELLFRNRDNKIVSDRFVTITSDDEKIEGYGFESDQGLDNYTIFNITYYTRLDKKK